MRIGIIASCFLVVASASAERKERIIVTGSAMEQDVTPYPVTATIGGNASAFMRNVAGGDLNTNGQLSGLPQYRGMFAGRMNVRVNQSYIAPAGPTWMDPPMHYAPKPLIESIEMTRGISSVSDGPGIGGYVNVNLKTSRFASGDQFEMQGNVDLSAHSVDDGYNAGFIWAVANNRHRFHVIGSRDDGDDTKTGDGRIDGSEYVRDSFGIGYGLNKNGHDLSLDFHRINTGDSNTPVLPLDIGYYHSSFGRGVYKTSWRGFDVKISAYRNTIDHWMSNYHLRPASDFDNLPVPDDMKLPPFRGTDRRNSHVVGDGDGFSLHLGHDWMGGYFKVGVDSNSDDHGGVIRDPDVAPFYIDNINNAEVDRLGLFAEWKGQFAEHWGMEFGVRYHQVDTNADEVQAFPADLADRGTNNPVTDNVRTLRDDFNAADRRKRDHNLDAVLGLSYLTQANAKWSLTASRKTRSPDYVERYLWMPLEINSGLGDGNNYVGNPNLRPEVSYELEVGLDWNEERFYFQPRVYHRWIDDFIQGVAVDDSAVVAVSNLANGDPNPKQFANIDAKIYGIDAYFGYSFNSLWRLDGLFSVVRGQRRDISDNLFRISPHKLQLALTHLMSFGSLTAETVMVDEQDKLARALLDPENLGGNINTGATPGYVLFNLRGNFNWPGEYAPSMSIGIENILDKHYHDHTATFNRIQNSDVRVGERLPGAGRGIYADFEWEW